MGMRARAVAVAFMLLAGCNSSQQSTLSPKSDVPGGLDIDLSYKPFPGEPALYLTAKNTSADVLCFSSMQTDPASRAMIFFDSADLVVYGASSDGGSETGTSWNDSYVFIRPNETRTYFLPIDRIPRDRKPVRYSLTWVYFRCQDIATDRAAGTEIRAPRLSTVVDHHLIAGAAAAKP